MIALIAVSSAVFAMDKPYSYRVPDHMLLSVGVRVIVPFGKSNRRTEGIVLSVQNSDEDGLKSIEVMLDETPILSEQAIRLAAFIRERYFCTFYDAIKAILPAGHWFDPKEYVEITDPTCDFAALVKAKPQAMELIDLLLQFGGKSDRVDLKNSLPEDYPLDEILRYLTNKHLIRANASFSKRTKDRTEQIATLQVPAEEAMEYAERQRKRAPQQYEVLKLLCAVGEGSVKEITYLTGASTATIHRLEKTGFLYLSQKEVFRCPLPEYVAPAEPIQLNKEQLVAYEGLLTQIRQSEPGTALLYGVTGSGKTSVYISLIKFVLQSGRSAIFMVPEIALTPQFITLLMSHFGTEVAVLHSGLRVSSRYDEWKRINNGKARVVIGTRSAVFAPVNNLGLIILDEEQEHTYKSENTPRYHAREVAIYRGAKEHALVLLGSATPSLESMYLAEKGVYRLYRLHNRYNQRSLPKAELVDMKPELRSGNAGSISKHLREAIRQNLQDKKQSILFLNRRGAGRSMICVDCGEVLTCPRCSVSLTYHSVNNRAMCHYCGYSIPASDRCDQCGGHRKMIGTGTQKVEQELRTLFPDVSIIRMDADTIHANNTHEDILKRFEQENIPILLGTQMVAKGLHFENVTLVGVLDADMSLYVDQFRASETTFSMITQVIGRSGRGASSGRALVQTMTPEHTVLQLAAIQDYDTFYQQEITLRQLHSCPPFGDLLTVCFVGQNEGTVFTAAGQFKLLFLDTISKPPYNTMQVSVLGPAPASVAKINNAFRFRVIIRCLNQKPLRQVLAWCIRQFSKDRRSKETSIYVDTNSYE